MSLKSSDDNDALTCSVKPGLNDELIECFCIDDVCKTSRAEVSALGVDNYASQVDVGFHRCEANITEPLSTRSIVIVIVRRVRLTTSL
jgi:hypothetical protein